MRFSTYLPLPAGEAMIYPKSHPRSLAAWLAFPLLLVLPALAPAQGSEGPVQKVVRFALLIDGRQVMEASAIRDEMVTVQIDDRGHYGFLTKITGAGTVAIDIFSIGSAQGERRLLETLFLDIGQRVTLAADPGLAVQVSEVLIDSELLRKRQSPIKLASLSYVSFREFAVSSSGCCVKCGEVTACGCAVTMSCGCCCAGCSNPECEEIECSSPLASGFFSGFNTCAQRFEDLIARVGHRGA